VGRPEERITFGKPSYRWEGNNKMDFLRNLMQGHGLNWFGQGYEQVAGICE